MSAYPNEPDAGERACEPAWGVLVDQIRAGETSGMESLYRIFSGGVRFKFYRRFGAQDLDDKVHDVFLIVAEAIRKGDLRDPDRLMGFVSTVVRRQVAGYIDGAVRSRAKQTVLESEMPVSDGRPDPERDAIDRQETEIAMRILHSAPRRDREVLVRFYLREQTPAEICRDLELTETQFRLIKSRAKARFVELGKTRLGIREVFRSR